MVQRPVAVTDLERTGGGDRPGDVNFGLAARCLLVEPLSQPGRDRRRQRAAGAVQIFCRDTLRRKADHVTLPDQEIDTVVARAVAALDENVAGPEREQLASLDFHFLLIARR